jgi:hypothetical protein
METKRRSIGGEATTRVTNMMCDEDKSEDEGKDSTAATRAESEDDEGRETEREDKSIVLYG